MSIYLKLHGQTVYKLLRCKVNSLHITYDIVFEREILLYEQKVVICVTYNYIK